MAERNYIVSQEGLARSYTINTGVGPAGQDGVGLGNIEYDDLLDKTTVDLPTVNTPLANALAGKAPSLGANDNYVTDAEKVVIANTSGVNTGDQDLSGYAAITANNTWTGLQTFGGGFTVNAASVYGPLVSFLYLGSAAATHRTALGLGSAATSNTGDFATAAQGSLADTAVQPAALADYLPLAGGVTMEGGIDFGNFNIQNVGEISAVEFSSPGANPAAFPHGLDFGGSYLATINAAPTAPRTITFPDASGTVALTSDLSAYQPLDTQLTSLAGLSYTSNTLKVVRVNAGETGFELATISAGGGDAVTSGTLDQFADVSQTGGATLTISSSTTLGGGSHSGTNTGDQTNITGNAGTVTSIGDLTGVVTSTNRATSIANGAISNAMLANGAVANLSGTNTGDNAVNSLYSGLVSNATHTGDVTGATALTIDKTAITGKTAATAASTDYVLISDTSDSGNLKKALVSDFGGGGGGELVALGTVSVTSAADIKLDNIFDDTLYDHYIYSLKILPATDNVSLIAKLRNATPADAVTIRRMGGAFTRMDTAGNGTFSETGVVVSGLSSTSGREVSIRGSIVINSGSLHFIAADIHIHTQGSNGLYVQRYIGDFDDTTARQGIKFEMSSGNVASGALSVWGVLKQ